MKKIFLLSVLITTLSLNCTLPITSMSKNSSKNVNIQINELLDGGDVSFAVSPNPVSGTLNLVSDENLSSIFISDITVKEFIQLKK